MVFLTFQSGSKQHTNQKTDTATPVQSCAAEHFLIQPNSAWLRHLQVSDQNQASVRKHGPVSKWPFFSKEAVLRSSVSCGVMLLAVVWDRSAGEEFFLAEFRFRSAVCPVPPFNAVLACDADRMCQEIKPNETHLQGESGTCSISAVCISAVCISAGGGAHTDRTSPRPPLPPQPSPQGGEDLLRFFSLWHWNLHKRHQWCSSRVTF